MYYFHVGATKSGAHSWWLYSPNHEQVAWAGETFGLFPIEGVGPDFAVVGASVRG